jgi:hypothetical protein
MVCCETSNEGVLLLNVRTSYCLLYGGSGDVKTRVVIAKLLTSYIVLEVLFRGSSKAQGGRCYRPLAAHQKDMRRN